MPRFTFVRHWADCVSQSGIAGHPIGEKAHSVIRIAQSVMDSIHWPDNAIETYADYKTVDNTSQMKNVRENDTSRTLTKRFISFRLLLE